ncbi:MAG: hypothetical protein M3Y64_07345, partial [Gemmatimonadota bacterium]|nr:hypothetical protein [Gemmatimonadota bacterium]
MFEQCAAGLMTFARRQSLKLLMLVLGVGCSDAGQVSAAQRRTIADSLQALVMQAYDFSRPDARVRLLSLYPDSGRVISASAGRITTSR